MFYDVYIVYHANICCVLRARNWWEKKTKNFKSDTIWVDVMRLLQLLLKKKRLETETYFSGVNNESGT